MTDDLIQDLDWVENCLFPGWQNVVQRAIDRLQPVEPILDKRSVNPFHRCSYCNEPLENFDKYCWNCGRKIKWE